MMSREICKICYHVNAVGFHVPDCVWEAIVPEFAQNGVVCLTCFTRLGDEKGINWSDNIAFFPVSLALHLTPQDVGATGVKRIALLCNTMQP